MSNGSCTTNCLAPVAYVLHEGIGIERGYMTTIHAYTGDQNTVDTLHKDLRRARAAALSMIPTSTGAARAMGLVLPALQGQAGRHLDPRADGRRLADRSHLHRGARHRARTRSTSSWSRRRTPTASRASSPSTATRCVSVDFTHDPHSATFDLTQTVVLGKRFCRVLAWYDNEWGFSNRMVEAAALVGALG